MIYPFYDLLVDAFFLSNENVDSLLYSVPFTRSFSPVPVMAQNSQGDAFFLSNENVDPLHYSVPFIRSCVRGTQVKRPPN
jgi:hypothetical protein